MAEPENRTPFVHRTFTLGVAWYAHLGRERFERAPKTNEALNAEVATIESELQRVFDLILASGGIASPEPVEDIARQSAMLAGFVQARIDAGLA